MERRGQKSTEKKDWKGVNIGKVWKMHKMEGKIAEIHRILLLFSPKKGIIIIMGQNGTFLFHKSGKIHILSVKLLFHSYRRT